jgi:membrane fusion protein, copper/silver efflux system
MKHLVGAAVLVLGTAISATAAELPGSLVDPYLRVQAALAADKTDSVKQDAAQIGIAAAALGESAKPLVEAAERLGRAGDLKAARDAFGQVSERLLAYAKTTGATSPAGVKTAFCPMANKSWLQTGETIKNPYYGSEMLECGEWKK